MSAEIVCAIILNWNLKHETIACVHSVLANERVAKVIIVDNNSQDGSVAAFQAEFGGTIDIVANSQNYGYASGMNIGIRYALEHTDCEFILLLNNDTILDRKMIYQLVSAAVLDDKIGITSPMILFSYDKNRIWNLGDRQYSWLPFPLSVRKNKIDKGDLQPPFDVDYVTGCGMLVKREVFETSGLFDPIYVMYGEDADFCRRVKDSGYRIMCVPTAKMWHRVALSSNKNKPRNRFFRMKGQTVFYRKFRHGPHPLLTHLYFLLNCFRIGLMDLFVGNFSLLRPLILGLWAGYREPLNKTSIPKTTPARVGSRPPISPTHSKRSPSADRLPSE